MRFNAKILPIVVEYFIQMTLAIQLGQRRRRHRQFLHCANLILIEFYNERLFGQQQHRKRFPFEILNKSLNRCRIQQFQSKNIALF